MRRVFGAACNAESRNHPARYWEGAKLAIQKVW